MNTEPRTRETGFAMTLDEIALHMGISRRMVQKLEQKAMRKLRKALKERGARASDFYDTQESSKGDAA